MNINYKTIYNDQTGAWVAVSELKATIGKKSISGCVKQSSDLTNKCSIMMKSVLALSVALLTNTNVFAQYSTGSAVLGGLGSVAIGGNLNEEALVPASATGLYAVSIGTNSVVKGSHSIALGVSSTARGRSSVALGNSSIAEAPGAMALGPVAYAEGSDSMALGLNSRSSGDQSIAIGINSESKSYNSIALGKETSAIAASAVAIGHGSVASNIGAISLGSNHTNSSIPTKSSGKHSVAIGSAAQTSIDHSVVIGSYSLYGETELINNSISTTLASLDASDSMKSPLSAGVSVGSLANERRVVNVANGRVLSGSTDAVNGDQLFVISTSMSTVSSSLSSLSISTSTGLSTVSNNVDSLSTSTLAGFSTVMSGMGSLSTGLSSTNSEVASLSATTLIGLRTVTSSVESLSTANSMAISNGIAGRVGSVLASVSSLNTEVASTLSTVELLSTSVSAGLSELAGDVGLLSSTVMAIDSLGTKYLRANASAGDPVAQAIGIGSIAMGSGATAQNANDVAIGNSAVASGGNSVALGAGSVATEPNTISVGYAGNERRISSIAPGIKGTDAVNVNQLNEVTNYTNQQLKKSYGGVASALALESAPYVPGALTYSAGMGYFQGEGAIGLSIRHTAINNRWSITGGMTHGTSGGIGARLALTGVMGSYD